MRFAINTDTIATFNELGSRKLKARIVSNIEI